MHNLLWHGDVHHPKFFAVPHINGAFKRCFVVPSNVTDYWRLGISVVRISSILGLLAVRLEN